VLVVVLDEVVDLALEVGHGVKGAAADGALRNQSEPALNLVEPGGVGGGVVEVKARTPGEPGFDSGVPVGAVVIDNEMNVQMIGNIGLDVAQEAQKLLMPMPRFALCEDLAIGHIEGCEQRRGAVPDVVVGNAFHVPQPHRQQRLRALQSLYLALLIDSFSMKNGSVESLKDLDRWGCTPNSAR
jgi:hypothetical protein